MTVIADVDMLDEQDRDPGMDVPANSGEPIEISHANGLSVIAAHRYRNGARIAPVTLDRVEPISEDPSEFI